MYLIIIFIFLEVSLIDSSVDINFKTYEMCKETPATPMTFEATFRKINSSITLADLKAVLPVELGNDVDLDATLEVYRHEQWTMLYNVTNRKPCDIMHVFGGQLYTDLEKHFEVPAGTCPIPKGTYEARDYVIDFNKLLVKKIPKAVMRSRANLVKDGELLMCFYSEFEVL